MLARFHTLATRRHVSLLAVIVFLLSISIPVLANTVIAPNGIPQAIASGDIVYVGQGPTQSQPSWEIVSEVDGFVYGSNLSPNGWSATINDLGSPPTGAITAPIGAGAGWWYVLTYTCTDGKSYRVHFTVS